MLREERADVFRKGTFCFLGAWHVQKMASTCVWRMAAADFIAPLFHEFFPNSPFPWAPRLVLSTRIFSLIRLSYPTFRAELKAALAKEALSPIQRGHLKNLHALCEWFIPKVYPFFFFGMSVHSFVIRLSSSSSFSPSCQLLVLWFSINLYLSPFLS